MQISLLLMEEIVKLFVIMFMGYAVVKAGLMKSSESKSVSVILVYLVIPCVIIKAFQVDYTPDVQKGLFLAIAAAVADHHTTEENIPDGCDRTSYQHLFKCRNSGHPAGAGIIRSGLCDLFQCLYCSAVDFAVDAGKKYAV